MSWETGLQKPRKNTLVSNKEILEKKGFLDEREAKLLFYQFLRNNISFSASLLMGIELFPFQHIGINSMLKSDYSLCVWSRGLSKCAKFDSLVSTDKGIKQIIDVNVGDKILAKDNYCLVEDKVINEEQKTYKITSKRGYISEGLDYHRVLVLDKELNLNWKYSKDLNVGDVLAMRKGGEFFEQVDIFEGFDFKQTHGGIRSNLVNPKGTSISNWYYFFGLLLGDGYFSEARTGFTSQDVEIKLFLEQFCKEVGLHLIQWDGGNGVIEFTIASISLRAFLKHCGFETHVRAHKKTIPSRLLKCSKENAAMLLKGFFDTDGSVVGKLIRGNTHLTEVSCSSTSYYLLQQVRAILLQLGIISTTYFTRPSGDYLIRGNMHFCNASWTLKIRARENVLLYRDTIGFLIKRKMDRLSILDQSKFKNCEFSGYIPYLSDYLIKKYNKSSFYTGINGKKVEAIQLFKNTSRKVARQIIKYVDEETAKKISILADDNLFFDTVKSVEESRSVTVDLQVQGEHCYMSDGFINHNSFSAGICAGLDAMFSQGINIGILSSSYRQCLEENEYVLCESGLKKIKEVSVGEKLFAKDGLQEIKNKWINQKSVGINIKTRKGYSLKGKEEHRVLVFDPNTSTTFYKELKDIKIGDYLPISCESRGDGRNVVDDIKLAKRDHWCIKKFNQPTDSEDFYYLLGQFLGDGCVRRTDKHTSFNLTSADEETVSFTKNYLSSILPENSISIRQKEGSKAKEIGADSVLLGDFFEAMGYKMNQIAINKTIPKKILESRKGRIASFLRGFYDSDGGFNVQNQNGRKAAEITLNTSSKELAKQLQLLLLTFGITASVCTEKARGEMLICGVKTFGNESYKVRITNLNNIKRFAFKIGFRLSRKQNKLIDYLNGYSDRPEISCQLIHGRFPTCVKKSIELFYKQNPQYAHFFFDEIIQINKLDEIVTYDIEVDNEHCYWGNGFINHNSKMIFKKIEDIAAKPEAYLFRQAISKIRHSNDCWELEIGRSRITALPLGDGEKLRGYRFNRIYIDEFLLMPERVITEILSPFLAVVQEPQKRKEVYDLETKLIERGEMKEEDRYHFESNKLIALSSASYKFEYLYKLYQQYENLILNPKPDNNAKRCIIQLSYDCAPQHLYDQNQIDQAKATMSEAQFQREYGAQFTDESSGFFSARKIMSCTIPDGETPSVEAQGDPSEEYIAAIDPSWAENSNSDDFCVQILKINKEKQITTLVHSYAISGSSLRDHITYFYYLVTNFNIVAYVYDYNGGLVFMNSCNESELFRSKNIQFKVIETEFDKPEEYQQNLIKAKSEYNRTLNKTVFMRKPTSSWIRVANEQLQGSIDHGRIFFASPAIDGQFKTQTHKNVDIGNLKYRRKTAEEESLDDVDWEDGAKQVSSMIDFLEHIHDMIRLTKTQLSMIVPTTSVQGTQSFDLPKNLKGSGKDRARKDCYSALVLGNWISKIYFDMQSINVEETDSTFTPMMI